MTNRTIQIGKICKLNHKSISQNDKLDIIQYLDTANITKDKISELQILQVNKENIPSRAKRRVRDNTIIYSTVRPNQEHYGFLKNPDKNLIVSTGFTTIDIIDENIDPKFIYYLITQKQITDYLHTIGINAVSSYPSIKPEHIGNLKFEVPENVQDQHNIAYMLSALDSKIELNNKINDELEQILKILYDYWFIQFDYPNLHGVPYKSCGGKMIWNEKLKRKIPQDWEVFSIFDLLKESKNGDWGEERGNDSYIKTYCIRGTDINGLNGVSNFDPPVRYIESSHSNRLLKPGDLIIEISGGSPTQSTGKMAHISQDVLTRLQNKAVCSNFCKAISLKDENLSHIVNQYWNHLYESDVFFNYEGKTSGIKNLLFDQLIKDVKIARPNNNSLLKNYNDIAKDIDSQKQNNLIQNQKLTELRDWLLPMLMNGQVKVN